jgi:hypothetical protein
MKWIELEFKVDTSNGVYDFILFKFLKDVLILTSYTSLNALNGYYQFHMKGQDLKLVYLTMYMKFKLARLLKI